MLSCEGGRIRWCRQGSCVMKLRLALGVGALALLIAGLASWDGFDRPTLSGHILVVGPAGLPPLAAAEDDIGAFSLCVPRGETMFVHVLPFTRVLDARGRLFTTATSVAALQPGQRIQIWTIGESSVAAPQQLSALKIKITANAVAGEDAGVCELSSQGRSIDPTKDEERMSAAAAWYFSAFVGSFFARRGEKRTHKEQEIRGLR